MKVKNDDSTSLSTLVKKTRKLAGLSRNELAELAGVGKTLIFDLENGNSSIGFDNLKKVLQVLNIKLEFIPPEIEINYEKS